MLYIIAFIALKTHREAARRVVEAFHTSKEHSTHKFSTPFAKWSPTLNYVAQSHHIMETQTPFPILVKLSKPFLIAHSDVASLLRESQVLAQDHSSISIQIHGIEEVVCQLLNVFGPGLVVGISYLSHFLHSFRRASFLLIHPEESFGWFDGGGDPVRENQIKIMLATLGKRL